MKAITQTGIIPMDSFLGFLAKLSGMILLFLAPIKMVMFAIGFLIISDLFTGIWAARKRGEKITSNGFRNTVSKMLAYQLSVITAFIVQSHLLPDVPMVQIISAMIALTEIKSFFENIHDITGLDMWEAMLKKLHGNKKHTKKRKR